MNFFKSLYKKYQQFLIDNDIQEKPQTEQEKNFNLYIEKDVRIALELLDNGYIAEPYQLKKLDNTLNNIAQTDANFLFSFSQYEKFISSDVFITFLINHDLNIKCKNEKNIFENFKNIFENLTNRKDFSNLLNTKMVNSINYYTQQTIAMKPKHSSIHAFSDEQRFANPIVKLKLNIYNSLLMFPLTINHLNDFLILKSSICNASNEVQKHAEGGYYVSDNKKILSVSILKDWEKYINNYDISSIKSKALSEMIVSKTNDTENYFDNPHSSDFNYQINLLKMKLDQKFILQVDNIQSLYKNIYNDLFEKKENHELDDLYKELPNVLNKFISIHPDYRTSLRNVEGKNPEELMQESLNNIERKLNEYLEDINLDKVSDLSIAQRVIKMKT